MNSSESKFSRIYDRYVDKIYRFVFIKVNSQEVAEDLSSKVFLRTWDIFRQDESKIQNPRAFLYQVARNLVIDHYRDKGRTQFVSVDNLDLPDPRASIHERAIITADLIKVKQAMANLSDDYQNVIIWHYLDDLPIKEVSSMLNRSEDATRVLLSRALSSLRGHLTS